MNPATSAEAQFRAAAASMREKAAMLTTDETNSTGATATAVQPEGVVKLRTAALFDQLANDMAEIAKEKK